MLSSCSIHDATRWIQKFPGLCVLVVSTIGPLSPLNTADDPETSTVCVVVIIEVSVTGVVILPIAI